MNVTRDSTRSGSRWAHVSPRPTRIAARAYEGSPTKKPAQAHRKYAKTTVAGSVWNWIATTRPIATIGAAAKPKAAMRR